MLASAALLVGIFLAASPVNAQRAAQSAAVKGKSNSPYDPAREVSLQGTVAKFTENSATLPVGAHVLIQTAAGPVDVHLGDPRFLQLNKFSLTEGASIRVIGEAVSFPDGTFFLARLVQQGTQVIAVRTTQGFPLARAGVRANPDLAKNVEQGGAR